MRFILENDFIAKELAREERVRLVMRRLGLYPKKRNATEGLNKVAIALETMPLDAEEMSEITGIIRQTFYDYLDLWIELGFVKKTAKKVQRKTSRLYHLKACYELSRDDLKSSLLNVAKTIQAEISQTVEEIEKL